MFNESRIYELERQVGRLIREADANLAEQHRTSAIVFALLKRLGLTAKNGCHIVKIEELEK